jgi:hypothetical protein
LSLRRLIYLIGQGKEWERIGRGRIGSGMGLIRKMAQMEGAQLHLEKNFTAEETVNLL